MIGKAGRIKTKRIVDHFEQKDGQRQFVDIDTAINRFLEQLRDEAEIIQIQYSTVNTGDEYHQNALITYEGWFK